MKSLNKAATAVKSQLTKDNLNKVVGTINETGRWAKANPKEAFEVGCLATMTFIIADTSGEFEVMADATATSAVIDVWEYSGS